MLLIHLQEYKKKNKEEEERKRQQEAEKIVKEKEMKRIVHVSEWLVCFLQVYHLLQEVFV